MTTNRQLVPLLVVRAAASAIDFYVTALGATALARWLRQQLEDLSIDEIQRQRDDLLVRFAATAGSRDAAASLARVEDHDKLDDSIAPGQARDAAGRSTSSAAARLHLVVGPVGAGKSTFALRLAAEHAAVRLTLDEWMAVLFRPDRPDAGVMQWYAERTARCIEQIWALAEQMIAVGTAVVLEIGLLRRSEREEFYRRIADAGLESTIHVLDAAREVRRARVETRNRAQGPTFSMVVPPAIFELASDLWEPPEPAECHGRDVRFVRTD